MTQAEEEWGPWTEHDGKGFPVPVGTMVRRSLDVEIDYLRGEYIKPTSEITGPLEAGEIDSWLWVLPRVRRMGRVAKVVRYQVRQYRAMSMLKRVAALPEKVSAPEGVDA